MACESEVWAGEEKRDFQRRHGVMSPSELHSLSWNWNELVLHWVMSELIIVRSVKVTFPAASMRMTVLVLSNLNIRIRS